MTTNGEIIRTVNSLYRKVEKLEKAMASEATPWSAPERFYAGTAVSFTPSAAHTRCTVSKRG